MIWFNKYESWSPLWSGRVGFVGEDGEGCKEKNSLRANSFWKMVNVDVSVFCYNWAHSSKKKNIAKQII